MWPQCRFACNHARDRLHVHMYTAGEGGEIEDHIAQVSTNAGPCLMGLGSQRSQSFNLLHVYSVC